MSASTEKKCQACGSYYLSTMDGEKKLKCIDCCTEFHSTARQVVVNNRIRNHQIV